MSEETAKELLQRAGMKLIQAAAFTTGSQFANRECLTYISVARDLITHAEQRVERRLQALEEVDA